MVKRKGRKKRNNPFFQSSLSKSHGGKKKQILLDKFTLSELKAQKKRNDDLIKYHWDYYSELAIQREQIKDQIDDAIISKCDRNYTFSSWQRAVEYKYSFHPLSCVGSLRRSGRFNYGEDIGANFSTFPALYIASDKDTALQETLGQEKQSKEIGLSAKELALANPKSETIVSVSGELETIFDLTSSKNLTKFVNLTKSFKLSKKLKDEARKLKLDTPNVVDRPRLLFDTMMEKDWRGQLMLFDAPFNAQIFGHILLNAGVNGVLYKSKLTKKECVAIFPTTFANSNCYVELDHEAPLKEIPARVDSLNWKITTLTAKEVLNLN